MSVIAEATLTALPRNTFNAKLERLMLSYSPNDFFSASVGRYHTGIGYYNTAYHHGTWFQTATGRPLIFSIDGDIGVIPIHTLGVSASGAIPSGSLGLHYVAEFGSGRAGQSSAAVAPQPALNDNNTPSVNLGLCIRPETLDGLQVGVSLYHDRLTLADTSKAPIGETIGVAHIVYKTDVLELMTEGMLMRHDPRGTIPVGRFARLLRAGVATLRCRAPVRAHGLPRRPEDGSAARASSADAPVPPSACAMTSSRSPRSSCRPAI